MQVFIKGLDHKEWVDLSKYVSMPFTIIETADGTNNSCKITFRFPSDLPYFDVKKALKPKMQIKITEDKDNENYSNTYFFLTSDNNSVRLRKDVGDELKGIYEHIVNGISYFSLLDSRYLPNYTITQPKSRYFSSFRKSAKYTFEYNYKFSQDGFVKVLDEPESEYYNFQQSDDIYEFGYDLIESKPYLKISNDVDEKTFNVNISIDLAKTAATKTIFKQFNLIAKTLEIKPEVSPNHTTHGLQIKNTSELIFNFSVDYYNNNDEIIDSKPLVFKNNYSGGSVDIQQSIFVPQYITSLPTVEKQTYMINIDKNTNASYVVVSLNDIYARLERQRLSTIYTGAGDFIETRIDGYDDDILVKTFIENISFAVESSAYETAQEEKFTLLSEFVDKAIFDYNFNSRHKISLSDKARTSLDIPVKEGEWVDYTMKELLLRAFDYVNALPIMNDMNVIDIIEKGHSSIHLDLEQAQDKETQIIDLDYYDKIISNAKNLVSERDFVKERLVISSGESEFSQIEEKNAGFLLSNDIYFVSEAIIVTPPTFYIRVVTSEGNKDIYGNVLDEDNEIIVGRWDVTKRLFEKDIYESLPDARNDTLVRRQVSDNYTRGNTLFYKSGSNFVGGLGHQAPPMPEMNLLYESVNQAEYALIEILIILALEQAVDITTNPTPYLELHEFIDFELEITYVPFYKELTTKYVSNMTERIGLNWEKKVNVNERVISYNESAEKLKKEMERKGNVIESFTEKYESLVDTIPIFNEINDNLIVTTKAITVMNGYIDVDYTLQKNYILQNDDIRLPVEFERYNVPYEYVNREIFIENHLIFRKTVSLRYSNDPHAVNLDFINRMLKSQSELDQLEGLTYGKLRVDYDEKVSFLLMRMTKLEDRFSLVLAGKFLDNYTAGVQRYMSSLGEDRFYSQPLSYVKWNGKVDTIKRIDIGFNNYLDTRLEQIISGGAKSFDFKIFPQGVNASINVNLYSRDIEHLQLKDAREGISLNHTSFLTTEDQDIKWFSFKPPNKVAILNSNVELRDDLRFEDLDVTINNVGVSLNATYYPSHNNLFEIIGTIDSNHNNLYNIGIVLYREKDITRDGNVENELVGIIKEPYFKNNTQFEFYIISTRYGKLDRQEEIDQWQRHYAYLKNTLSSWSEVTDYYGMNDSVEEWAIVNKSISPTRLVLLESDVGSSLTTYDEVDDYYGMSDSVEGYVVVSEGVDSEFITVANVGNVLSAYDEVEDYYGINDSYEGYVETTVAIAQYNLGVSSIEGQLKVEFSVEDYYGLNDSVEEYVVPFSNLTNENIEQQNITSSLKLDYEVDDYYGLSDSYNGVVVTSSDLSVSSYGGVDVSNSLEIYEDVDDYYGLSDVVEELINTSSSITTTYHTITSVINQLQLDVVVTDGYGMNDSVDEDIVVSKSVSGDVYVSGGLSSSVVIDYEITDGYGLSDSVDEGVVVTKTISAAIEIPFSLSSPVVTTVTSNWCSEITIKVTNNNDVKVNVFGDGSFLDEINANSNKNFTFNHSLNPSKFGGTFTKTIKFVYQGHESSYNYSQVVSGICSPKI